MANYPDKLGILKICIMDEQIPMGFLLKSLEDNIHNNSKLSKIAFLISIPFIFAIITRNIMRLYFPNFFSSHKSFYMTISYLYFLSIILSIISLFFKNKNKSIPITNLLIAIAIGVFIKFG